jgi:hypothetical protein
MYKSSGLARIDTENKHRGGREILERVRSESTPSIVPMT